MTIKNEKLIEEYNEFISYSDQSISKNIQNNILNYVDCELNPDPKTVYLKALGYHALVSLFSLSVCSQFGIQTFKIYDVMAVIMPRIGHLPCMAFCGFLYLSTSAFILSLGLNREEIKVIKQQRFLPLIFLSFFSLIFFFFVNNEVVLMPSLSWIIGSILGAILTFEFGFNLRLKFS